MRKKNPTTGANCIPLSRNQYTNKSFARILTNRFETLKEEILVSVTKPAKTTSARKTPVPSTNPVPPTFTGDSSRAEQSLKAIKAYVWTLAEGKTPIEKTHLVLTCCQGPAISKWAKTIAEHLDTLSKEDDVSKVWITFVQLFRKKFWVKSEGLPKEVP